MSWGGQTMKSKRSCFSGALLRRNLSRFWAVWALAALVGSLAYFGVANEAVRYLRLLCGGTDHYRYLNVSSNVDMSIWSFLCALGAAVCAFGYLHQEQAAYMLHSFPLTRGAIFRTQLLAGFLMGCAPILGAALVYVIWIVLHAPHLFSAAVWLGVCLEKICEFLFFYALAVLCMQLSGRTLFSVLFYILLNFLALPLAGLIYVLFEPLLRDSTSLSAAMNTSMYFSPVVKLLRSPGSGYSLALLPCGILLLVPAWLMDRRRKLECCGKVVAYRFLRPVLFGLLAVLSAALCAVLGTYLLSRSSASGLPGGVVLLCLLGAAAGFFGGLLLLGQRARAMRRSGVILFLCVALVLTCGTGLLRALCQTETDPIPASAEIVDYVELSPADPAEYDAYNVNFLPNGNLRVKLTSKADISDVIALHEQILAHQSETATAAGTDSICIIYHIDGGGFARFNYRFDRNADAEVQQLCDSIRALLNRPAFASDFFRDLHLEDAAASELRFQPLFHGTDAREVCKLDIAQQQRLVAALLSDAQTGSLRVFSGQYASGDDRYDRIDQTRYLELSNTQTIRTYVDFTFENGSHAAIQLDADSAAYALCQQFRSTSEP